MKFKKGRDYMAKINVNLSYPYSEDYEYETCLERINLDEERIHDLITDNGFVIGKPHGIKKDLRDPNGIFSSRYGKTLKDITPLSNPYRCNCGHLQGRINNRSTCPICGSQVRYVDENFGYFGWKVLDDPNYIIHPNLFKSLENFIGKDTLDSIIFKVEETDIDGHVVERKNGQDFREASRRVWQGEHERRFIPVNASQDLIGRPAVRDREEAGEIPFVGLDALCQDLKPIDLGGHFSADGGVSF